VWHDGAGPAATRTRTRDRDLPDPLERARAGQKAVALAQQERSTWTRADLIKYLGRVLPRTGMDPAAAASVIEDLADRALRSEFEPVICLEAPEAVQVSRSLLRADGRSIYQRHGGVRYAARAQLAMEERLVTLARAAAARRLTRAAAARALGADLARLEDTLAGRAQEIQNHYPERTGLTADQAAAVLSVLTDGNRVSGRPITTPEFQASVRNWSVVIPWREREPSCRQAAWSSVRTALTARNLCRCRLVSSSAVPMGSGTRLSRNARSIHSRSGFFRPGMPVAAALARMAEISAGRGTCPLRSPSWMSSSWAVSSTPVFPGAESVRAGGEVVRSALSPTLSGARISNDTLPGPSYVVDT
jgi:hypothetical protein